jgi:hypothetical protein
VKRFQQERHSKTLRKLGVSSKSALAGVSKNQ